VLVPDDGVHELGQLQDLQQAVVLGQRQAGQSPATPTFETLFLCIKKSWCGSPIPTETVFRIRIHRIHMFLVLLDPDPDPLVRGMDPNSDPARIRILQSLSKNSKKNLISTVL
jgi:hypothetical protein